ncbi:MAG: hypothetical protein Q7S56_00235 [Nanoarchaeota archaeon]|nr:hypothetical protein [Nanoarchaeota archaeon]
MHKLNGLERSIKFDDLIIKGILIATAAALCYIAFSGNSRGNAEVQVNYRTVNSQSYIPQSYNPGK